MKARVVSPCYLLLLLLLLLQCPLSHAGIGGFWTFFKGYFKDAVVGVKAGQSAEFDHVLVDVNQLLHRTFRKAESEDEAVAKLLTVLKQTLKVCRPRKSVVIAFDGSAPLAKLLTQRKRRSRSKVHKKYIMNSLLLSPGTDFMATAAKACLNFASNRILVLPEYRKVTFYISDSTAPGEGEVKLMDWIIRHVGHKDESVVVVGGDADLVLQGLALPGLPDFHVFLPELKNTGSLVSLHDLVNILEQLYPGQSHAVRNDLVLLLVMNGNDYLPKVRGVSFKVAFRTYQKMRMSPKYGDKYFLDPVERTFNWDFLAAYYESLPPMCERHDEPENIVVSGPTPAAVLHTLHAQKKILGDLSVEIMETYVIPGSLPQWRCHVRLNETTFLSEIHASKKLAKQEACAIALKALAPETYDELFPAGTAVEEKEQDSEDDQEGEEDEDFEDDEDEEGEEDDAEEDPEAKYLRSYDVETYLKGLLWTVQMYIDGYCPDHQFAYRYKFAPSVRTLATWIRDRQASENEQLTFNAPVSYKPPLHATVACLAMMPPDSFDVVPGNLSDVVKNNNDLTRMYAKTSSKFSVDLLMKALAKYDEYKVIAESENKPRMDWVMVRAKTSRLDEIQDFSSQWDQLKYHPPLWLSPIPADSPIDIKRLLRFRSLEATKTPPFRSWVKPDVRSARLSRRMRGHRLFRYRRRSPPRTTMQILLTSPKSLAGMSSLVRSMCIR